MDAHRGIVARHRGSLGAVLGALVVLALVFGPGVVDDLNGSELVAEVQAGAAVDATRGDPGNLTVRWTSNQNADNLTVLVEGPADVAGPTNTRRVLLWEPGQVVAFEELGATAENTTVKVVVTATAATGEHSVIVSKDVVL